MKFLATLLFAAIGVSAASSATSPDTPGSTCQADFILEDCLASTTKIANACKGTDYQCLCASYQAVLTCYNNCPNDIRAPSAQQQADSWCRTASLLATTPTTPPKTKTSDSSNSEETSAAPGNDDASPTTAGSSETTGTRTSATTAARSSSTNAAAATMIGSVAGIAMAVAGAAVAMI
ncbi:hypothetical protein TARUN_9777 [Trichoderma arundinaceum]|uniref:Gpi anchored serine-threonine rich n=1 Tax=Trichoderma arundinaceum TaxID=490622 RepID=A0A395N8L2_TRIAR|nr:hypothetical protein TARUN_9777 [Trichoderma arundinaceum]